MRVLVTEDDVVLAAFLRKTLLLEGYEVEVAANGRSLMDRVRASRYDLLLLDLTLPDTDGVDLLEQLRELVGGTPLIVLTGRTQLDERVRCLDLGADDFLVKPFSFGELLARCRAVCRRRQSSAESTLCAGELRLNRLERSAQWAGVPVDLTRKEFALLELLMLREGVCCSREDLLLHVWPGTGSSGSNVVDVYINYVRRKLNAAARASGEFPGALIQTVRGSGYRVVANQPATRFELSA